MTRTLAMALMQPGFLLECRDLYGDPFTVRLPRGRTMVLFSDPTAMRAIFAASGDDLEAGASTAELLGPYVGSNSLLVLDGARHLRERRLMMPSFHGERMTAYVEIMAEATRRDMATWPLGEPFVLRPHAQLITLDVILRAVFGVENDGVMPGLRQQLLYLVTMSVSRMGGVSDMARRTRQELDSTLVGEVRRRRREPDLATRTDILSMLLQARFEDGGGLSDTDLRDELITLLLAGHDTTATALSWALDLLLHHPDVTHRLESELAAGDETYLDAVVKEVLRLRPVIPQVGRRVRREVEIEGTLLPPGVIAAPSIFLAHHRADLYPEPLAFRPERFLDRGADMYAWLPFGGGPRRCIGAAFATTEIKVVLRTILAGATLAAADPTMESPSVRITSMVPKNGTRVILEARR